MYYKKVLVISDNSRIVEQFKEVLKRRSYDVQFTFANTILSEPLPENQKINFDTLVDLRNEDEISSILANFDLVISLHCKQLFPPPLVQGVKCINIHPGYNPINRGWFPQVFSILHKVDIGATIHEIDEELDHGLIIAREKVKKEPWDTSSSLYSKIIKKEIELLERYLDQILENSYTGIQPETEGHLFLKKDFNRLKKLDLNAPVTVGSCIDHLRAMTFEGYDNCYFITEEGVKVYVSIQLKPEFPLTNTQ